MWLVYILFFVPLLLFVSGFLYETYLSLRRLKDPKAGRKGYVDATWEVTHTLLIFTVVILVMMFTKDIDRIAEAIFTTTFLAAVALVIRAITYIQIFYVRSKPKTNWIDVTFALSHIFAALLLVATVMKAVWFMFSEKPEANLQFLPYFIPGLILVLAVCAVPMIMLYTGKNND